MNPLSSTLFLSEMKNGDAILISFFFCNKKQKQFARFQVPIYNKIEFQFIYGKRKNERDSKKCRPAFDN